MLTAETVRQLLNYDSATGVFIWKPKPGSARYDRAWNKRFEAAKKYHGEFARAA